MFQFLSIIFFLGFLQFLLGVSKFPFFCVTLCDVYFLSPLHAPGRQFNSDESGSKFGTVSAISKKRRRDRLHLEDQGTGNTPKPS